MNWLEPFGFLIFALAAFRVTRLITADSLIQRPRDWVLRHTNGFLNDLIECPWCIGFWISAVAVGAWSLDVLVLQVLAAVFAMSAVVGVLSRGDN